MSNEAERLLKAAERLESSWQGSDNCTYGNECYEEHWDFVIESRAELKKAAAEFRALDDPKGEK